MLDNLLNPRPYDVVIKFKLLEGDAIRRKDIVGTMPRSDYKRLLRDLLSGARGVGYRITIDNVPSEWTGPLNEIDTIHAVVSEPEAQLVRKAAEADNATA